MWYNEDLTSQERFHLRYGLSFPLKYIYFLCVIVTLFCFFLIDRKYSVFYKKLVFVTTFGVKGTIQGFCTKAEALTIYITGSHLTINASSVIVLPSFQGLIGFSLFQSTIKINSQRLSTCSTFGIYIWIKLQTDLNHSWWCIHKQNWRSENKASPFMWHVMLISRFKLLHAPMDNTFGLRHGDW